MDKGIKKLDEAVNDDLQDVLDRLMRFVLMIMHTQAMRKVR